MRTELLLPQNQTVCIRVKEVQVCCNRWLKRERWLSSFCRTGAFFYRILESWIWTPPDRLICPLRTRFRSGRNAADTYGCKGRSLSAGVTLRSLTNILFIQAPANRQIKRLLKSKKVQAGRCFTHRRKADTLSGQDSALLKGKKAPISPGFDSGSVLGRSDAAMCRLRTVKERRHLSCVFCSLMCRCVPS